MALETSCGAVLYTLRDNVPYYLIIETNSGHISFPKGHMEGDETPFETACREIWEETGICVTAFLPDFSEVYSYTSKRGNEKDVVFFLADYGGQAVSLQEKELVNHWEVGFDEAMKLLNREREKEILERAHAYIFERVLP